MKALAFGMASRFVVRGVNSSCGRVTVAPGALLRGSDAPDRPQSFFGFSQLRRQRPIWVMVAVSRLRLCPEYRAAQQRIRPTRCSSARTSSARRFRPHPCAVRLVHSRAWAGPGGYRLPFPCGLIWAPSTRASAHRGAGSAPSNSSLQRTRVPSSRFFQHCGSPLSSVSLGRAIARHSMHARSRVTRFLACLAFRSRAARALNATLRPPQSRPPATSSSRIVGALVLHLHRVARGLAHLAPQSLSLPRSAGGPQANSHRGRAARSRRSSPALTPWSSSVACPANAPQRVCRCAVDCTAVRPGSQPRPGLAYLARGASAHARALPGRGLTTRCSGLATLAAELDIVRRRRIEAWPTLAFATHDLHRRRSERPPVGPCAPAGAVRVFSASALHSPRSIRSSRLAHGRLRAVIASGRASSAALQHLDALRPGSSSSCSSTPPSRGCRGHAHLPNALVHAAGRLSPYRVRPRDIRGVVRTSASVMAARRRLTTRCSGLATLAAELDIVRQHNHGMASTSGNRPGSPEELECSFCSRPRRHVRQIIAGPNAHICNECVETCVSVLVSAEAIDPVVREALTEHLAASQEKRARPAQVKRLPISSPVASVRGPSRPNRR